MERERDRNFDVRENGLVASCTWPDWELNLQPRHVLWLGIEPTTFWFTGQCPVH